MTPTPDHQAREAAGKVLQRDYESQYEYRGDGAEFTALASEAIDAYLAALSPMPDEQLVSAEVLDEYRRIAAWLEQKAAALGPVGDTMHGLAAEALARLIKRENARHGIPLYGMLDVWMALYGTSHPEFDEFYAANGYAETWSALLAEVRRLRALPAHPTEETVTTVEEFRALLNGTALCDANGDIPEVRNSGVLMTGDTGLHSPSWAKYPARILYRPVESEES